MSNGKRGVGATRTSGRCCSARPPEGNCSSILTVVRMVSSTARAPAGLRSIKYRRWQRDRQARVANSAASSTKAREGRLDLCFGRKFTARGLCQRLVDRREFLVTGVISFAQAIQREQQLGRLILACSRPIADRSQRLFH